MIVGLWVLNLFARPITPMRALLVGSMVGAFVVILAVPALRDFFALNIPREAVTALLCGLVASWCSRSAGS